MCLYVKPGTRKRTAKKDITVYKILKGKYYRYGDVMHSRTPFRRMRVDTNGVHKSKLIVIKRPWMMTHDDTKKGNLVVDIGLHTFATLEKAKRIKGFLYRGGYNEYDPLFIVKAIIPKGSKYYIGAEEDIVSDTLKYGELKDID